MENKKDFTNNENLNDKNEKIAELFEETSKTEEMPTDKDGKSEERKKRLDMGGLLDKAKSSNIDTLLNRIVHNKKVTVFVIIVLIGVGGLYFYDTFIRPPKYDTLPNINISSHRANKKIVYHKTVNKQKTRTALSVKPAKSTKKNNNSIPVPVLQTGVSKSASSMNAMVKSNTKAIVKATKEQEQKLFDIFKIEPEEEYKIDRLIDLAQKQNRFLSVEVSILQKKKKIDSLLGALQKRKRSESLMQNKINMLINEIANLKSKVGSEQSTPKGHSGKLSPNNPFPFSAMQNKSGYLDEINSLSVGIIYTYKNHRKIAVVNDNGRIFRVTKGSKVTKHYYVKNIRPDGIVVSASPKSRGVFIPLSFNTGSQKKSLKFGIVNRKQLSQTNSPPIETQPVNPQSVNNMPNGNGNGGF